MTTAVQEPDSVEVQLPTGAEIYDGLMADIEPDLVSDAIPLIDAKYAGETPEQTAERLARYNAAYAEYDRQFTQWADEMEVLVNAYRKDALKLEEQDSKVQENAELGNLEAQFSDPTSSTPSV